MAETEQTTEEDRFIAMTSHKGVLYVGTASGRIYAWDGSRWQRFPDVPKRGED